MIKDLMISPSFYPAFYYGGPIYCTYDLAKALKNEGIEIEVITTNANGNGKLKIKTGVFHKLENDFPVKYYCSVDSRGTSFTMFFNLFKAIKKADIIHLISVFSPPTPITVFLCKLYRKPLIISPHGQLGEWCLSQGNKFKKLWLRIFIQPIIHSVNAALYWHLTSTAEEQGVLSAYPSAKTFVIPNGVSQELFLINVKQKDRSFYNTYTGFDCTKMKIIISLSRIHKVKGYDILIEAIGMINRTDLILLIAGEDFGERQNLEWLIDKLGMKEKVFFIEHIEGKEKLNFQCNADVFALPSHNENFGIVYAESLAAGTPIVASTNTPWQDVEKYNCGKWVENTSEKFAAAINEILNSDSVEMGKNGQKFVEENFSWEKIGKDFKIMLNKILNSSY